MRNKWNGRFQRGFSRLLCLSFDFVNCRQSVVFRDVSDESGPSSKNTQTVDELAKKCEWIAVRV